MGGFAGCGRCVGDQVDDVMVILAACGPGGAEAEARRQEGGWALAAPGLQGE